MTSAATHCGHSIANRQWKRVTASSAASKDRSGLRNRRDFLRRSVWCPGSMGTSTVSCGAIYPATVPSTMTCHSPALLSIQGPMPMPNRVRVSVRVALMMFLPIA